MFAVLKTGGKQYKVSAGDVIRVEKLEGDAGNSLEFAQVMMIGDGNSTHIGDPHLANSLVKGTILEQTRNKTVIIYKKRRRQGYDRKNGHRQRVSLLHIDEIIQNGKSIAKATAPSIKPKEQPEPQKKEKISAPQKAAPKVTTPKPTTPKATTEETAQPKAKPAAEKKAAPKATAKATAEKKATTKKAPAKKSKE